MSWRLSVQEHLLDGDTLEAKFEQVVACGFDGIELRGNGNGSFAARLPEIHAARAAGVTISSVCVMMDHFIGDFDPQRRRSANAGMKELLSVIAEAGGVGAITPAAYGLFSRHLPPFVPPRTPDEDREVLLTELADLGAHAASVGSIVLLEPLNRYEDHMVNTVADAASLVQELGLDSVRVMADTFHMNIEETDPGQALRDVAPWLGLIQLGDSSRLEPGSGHVDWAAYVDALTDIGYTGWLAMECGLSGPAAEVLPTVASLLRP